MNDAQGATDVVDEVDADAGEEQPSNATRRLPIKAAQSTRRQLATPAAIRMVRLPSSSSTVRPGSSSAEGTHSLRRRVVPHHVRGVSQRVEDTPATK